MGKRKVYVKSEDVAPQHFHPCYRCEILYQCEVTHSYVSENQDDGMTRAGARCCVECKNWMRRALTRLGVVNERQSFA